MIPDCSVLRTFTVRKNIRNPLSRKLPVLSIIFCFIFLSYYHIKAHYIKKIPGYRCILSIYGYLFPLFCCDLDQTALWKSCNFYTGTSRCRLLEVFCVDGIDCCKVIHIVQKYHSTNNIFISNACCFQNSSQVFQCLMCLCLDAFPGSSPSWPEVNTIFPASTACT